MVYKVNWIDCKWSTYYMKLNICYIMRHNYISVKLKTDIKLNNI